MLSGLSAWRGFQGFYRSDNLTYAASIAYYTLLSLFPILLLAFALLGSAILGTLGLVAAIWADKFDQIAAFQNFVILPLTFLSGVFYSIHSLPAAWQSASHLNPFFYMIDGFRYGFFGVSDVEPLRSLAVVAAFLAGVSALTLALLRSGYKLRH